MYHYQASLRWILKIKTFSSVQLLSRVRLFATPWIAACQASLSITNSQSLFKLMSTSQWCHPAISSSVVPFSSCPQSLSALESFPMSQLFAWGGQSIGVSALASVLPMNTQDFGIHQLPCVRYYTKFYIIMFYQKKRKLKLEICCPRLFSY